MKSNHTEALRRIRSSLFHAASIALKHQIDIHSEFAKIMDNSIPKEVSQSLVETRAEEIKTEPPLQSLTDSIKEKLLPRERLVYETIHESSEPISIDEMLDKFKDNKDTRCSRPTLTSSVKILRVLGLITQTCVEEKVKYARIDFHGTSQPEKICR